MSDKFDNHNKKRALLMEVTDLGRDLETGGVDVEQYSTSIMETLQRFFRVKNKSVSEVRDELLRKK